MTVECLTLKTHQITNCGRMPDEEKFDQIECLTLGGISISLTAALRKQVKNAIFWNKNGRQAAILNPFDLIFCVLMRLRWVHLQPKYQINRSIRLQNFHQKLRKLAKMAYFRKQRWLPVGHIGSEQKIFW